MNTKDLLYIVAGAAGVFGVYYVATKMSGGSPRPATIGTTWSYGASPWQDYPGAANHASPSTPFGGIDVGQIIGTTKDVVGLVDTFSGWFN